MKQIKIIHYFGHETVLENPPDLAEMQKIVGGYIEYVRVLDRIEDEKFIYTVMYVNEEGLLQDLPMNEKATEIYLRNAREQIKRGVSPSTFWDLDNCIVTGDVIYFEGYTCEEVDKL